MLTRAMRLSSCAPPHVRASPPILLLSHLSCCLEVCYPFRVSAQKKLAEATPTTFARCARTGTLGTHLAAERQQQLWLARLLRDDALAGTSRHKMKGPSGTLGILAWAGPIVAASGSAARM